MHVQLCTHGPGVPSTIMHTVEMFTCIKIRCKRLRVLYYIYTIAIKACMVKHVLTNRQVLDRRSKEYYYYYMLQNTNILTTAYCYSSLLYCFADDAVIRPKHACTSGRLHTV
jgi:hypothetical protein